MVFGLGLLSGIVLCLLLAAWGTWCDTTRPPRGAVSPRNVPRHGGQVVMGPQQPRPQVQDHIPAAPPRGGSGQARAR